MTPSAGVPVSNAIHVASLADQGTGASRCPSVRCASAPRSSFTERLLAQHRHGGDPAAREELVRRYLPLARRLAERFHYTGEPATTCTRWRPWRSSRRSTTDTIPSAARRSTRAVPTILGELKHHLRRTVHVPGRPRAALKVTKASRALSAAPRPLAAADGGRRGHRPRRAGDRGP